jgi:hypothetical protein
LKSIGYDFGFWACRLILQKLGWVIRWESSVSRIQRREVVNCGLDEYTHMSDVFSNRGMVEKGVRTRGMYRVDLFSYPFPNTLVQRMHQVPKESVG